MSSCIIRWQTYFHQRFIGDHSLPSRFPRQEVVGAGWGDNSEDTEKFIIPSTLNQTSYICHKKERERECGRAERERGRKEENGSSPVKKTVLVSERSVQKSSLELWRHKGLILFFSYWLYVTMKISKTDDI